MLTINIWNDILKSSEGQTLTTYIKYKVKQINRNIVFTNENICDIVKEWKK